MNLKEKTVSGLAWSFAGNFFSHVITFIIGIILARLLTPTEYGLLGMVTIFTILIQPFVNSGFSQALIRKNDCTQKDFSTVFYFNFFVGILFYLILFLAAPYISFFFKELQLTKIIRILGLIIIIDSAALIQTTILTKNVNFKLQTKITVVSNIIAGCLGIFLAYKGYKVWSLVYREMAFHLITTAMLWIKNRWKPDAIFSFPVLKELFGFGSKLLASAILDKLYYNIYNLVIAKFFSAKELGLFTRAKMFKDLASENVTEIISRVAFPVLSSIQDAPDKLKNKYITIRNCTMFIVLPLMFGLSAISESLILTLLGEQWEESIIYLQLLAFLGIFYPMITFTRDLLFIYGRSGLFFRLNIFVKTLAVPAIIIGIIFGIKFMIVILILAGFLEFLVKAYYSGKLVGYSVSNQLKDLIPAFLLALAIGISLFIIEMLMQTRPVITLLIQILIGIAMLIGFSELFRIKEYFLIKDISFEKINSLVKIHKN